MSEPFRFKLRGKAGIERVVIQDDTGKRRVYLTTESKEFSTKDRMMTIEFENDDGTSNDVLFETTEDVDISLPSHFGYWNCGTNMENDRCSQVRDGIFAWKGSYQISFVIPNGKHSFRFVHDSLKRNLLD